MSEKQQCRPLALLLYLLPAGLALTDEREKRLSHGVLDMERSFEHVVDRDLQRASQAIVKKIREEEAKEDNPDLNDVSDEDLMKMNHECTSCDDKGVCHPCGRIVNGRTISSAEVEMRRNQKPLPKLEPEAQAAIEEALGRHYQVASKSRLKPHQVHLKHKPKHQNPHKHQNSHKTHNGHKAHKNHVVDDNRNEYDARYNEMMEEIKKERRGDPPAESEKSDDVGDLEDSFARASGLHVGAHHKGERDVEAERLNRIKKMQVKDEQELKGDEGDSNSASLLDEEEESGELNKLDKGEAKIAQQYASRSMHEELKKLENHMVQYIDGLNDSEISDMLAREKAYEAISDPAGAASLLEVGNRDPDENGVNAVEKQVDMLSKTVGDTYDKLDALKTQEAVANARPAILADLTSTMGKDISKSQKDSQKVLNDLRTVTNDFENTEESLVTSLRDKRDLDTSQAKLNQVRDEADNLLVSVASTTKDLVTIKEDLQDTEGALSATDAPSAMDADSTDVTDSAAMDPAVQKATDAMMNDSTPIGFGADANLTDADITNQAIAAASGKGDPQDMATEGTLPSALLRESEKEAEQQAEQQGDQGDQADASSLLDVGQRRSRGATASTLNIKSKQPPATLQQTAKEQVKEKLQEETLAGLNEHIENDLDHSADAANSTIVDLNSASALLVVGSAGLSQEGRDTSKTNDMNRLRNIVAAAIQDNDRAMAGAVTIRDDMQKASTYLNDASKGSADPKDQDDNDDSALLEVHHLERSAARDVKAAGSNRVLRRED